MEITLEKIELVKEKAGVTYKQAKEALEAVDGDVVDALIWLEDPKEDKDKSEAAKQTEQILSKLKELIKKGNVVKIVIRKDDETVLSLPVNAGIIGAILAPIPAVIGAIVAFGTKCTVEVVKTDGSTINVGESASDRFSEASGKAKEGFDKASEKAKEGFDQASDKMKKGFDQASDKVKEGLNKADDKVKEGLNKADDAFNKAVNSGYAKRKTTDEGDVTIDIDYDDGKTVDVEFEEVKEEPKEE